MTVRFIGTTFGSNSQWHLDEINLCQSIQRQVDAAWPDCQNLVINTTWFGPQFTNNEYNKFLELVQHSKFQQVFFISSVDPCSLTLPKIEEIVNQAGAERYYLLGNFDNQYQFTFIGTLLPKYFKHYTDQDIILKQPRHLYLNYNRKPRYHRIDLFQALEKNNLLSLGVSSLGNNNPTYSHRDKAPSKLLGEHPEDFAGTGNWNHSMEFGIPHDIHSLGNMDLWCNHFLTIAGETEFLPWDPMFITEKTWKPIIGMRPFVINGQTKIYSYLRDQGFRTFEQYWPQVKMEDIAEYQVHDSIVAVIKYLSSKTSQELTEIYNTMLSDLIHNRVRFFQFVEEQKHKIDHLFQ